MVDISKMDEDLQEIFAHIERIKQKNQIEEEPIVKQLEPIDVIRKTSGVTIGESDMQDFIDDDLFEIIGPADETREEVFEEEKITSMFVDSGLCDLCGKEMVLEEHLSGLIIRNEFFACESCCQDADKNVLDSWTSSRVASKEDVQPIALWLMQNKDKTKLF